MADAYHEGQTATNPKTGQTVMYKGGQWVNSAAPGGAPGAPFVAHQLSKEDRQVLDGLNTNAQQAGEVVHQYQDAAKAAHRLGTGQGRAMMMDAATRTDGGGLMDGLGAALIGGPLRMAGAITPQMTADYQTLKAIQMRRVLAEQTLQKGVQTEGDAARIKAGDINPSMEPSAYDEATQRGMGVAQRAQSRAQFYTKWAQQYGLNGTDPNGDSVENAFTKAQQAPTPGATKHFVFDPQSGKIVPK